MRPSIKFPLLIGVLPLLWIAVPVSRAQEALKADPVSTGSQTFSLTDTKDLALEGVKGESVEYRGRKAVRFTTEEGAEYGYAFLKGVQFRDGTIEADIANKVTTPPGVRMPGFIGIAFRSRSDASRYELIYLRPGNSKSENQSMRNHSVQYSSEPDFGWEKLRREWPLIYEAYADLEPEEWTHVKIEVHGRQAILYLNGSRNPSLIVDGLKGEDLQGEIALWTYAREEAYFSNIQVTNTKPELISNGGDAEGTWEVKYSSDAGSYSGTMKLVRHDNSVVGIWSGSFGPNQAVSGTWRDGYVDLSFGGVWPTQPGTVTATLDGWIDDNSAKGRMKVEGRADGVWTAARVK
jgi:hypothetical protein